MRVITRKETETPPVLLALPKSSGVSKPVEPDGERATWRPVEGPPMRRFPGALALGLLVAILAHTVLYGNDHAIGGSYNAILRALATMAVTAFIAFWLAFCLMSRGRLCQGSVLKAGISAVLPSLSGLSAAAFGWFWLAESLEDGHAWAPRGWIILALLASSALVRLLAFAALRALAKVAFAIECGGFKGRSPAWVLTAARPNLSEPLAQVLRLFSRPPPTRFNY